MPEEVMARLKPAHEFIVQGYQTQVSERGSGSQRQLLSLPGPCLLIRFSG